MEDVGIQQAVAVDTGGAMAQLAGVPYLRVYTILSHVDTVRYCPSTTNMNVCLSSITHDFAK